MKDRFTITCTACACVLDSQASTCHKCGAIEKNIHIVFHDNISFHDQLTTKEVEGTGKRKVRVHSINGHERSADGSIVYKERILDRRKDKYYEKVVDSDGNIIRLCDEKLSEHINRGNAKFGKKVS